MKPIKYSASTITPTTISVPPSPPGTPHVSGSVTTAIVFASIITSLLLLGLYCSFSRRRSISDARLRLVHQIQARMSSILENRPANVSLPVRKYTNEEMRANGKETEECPVCLVEFEEGEEVKVVDPGCEHVFHPVCIDRWLAMRDTCPVCRSAIVGDEIEWGEVWREEEDEWDEENMEEMDEVEGGEDQGDLVVNVENIVAVCGEGDGGQGRDGEAAINVEEDGGQRAQGEGEVVVNVESAVLSERIMDVENRATEGREEEVVNFERDAEGGEGEVRVTVEEEEGVNGLEAEDEELVDTTRGRIVGKWLLST